MPYSEFYPPQGQARAVQIDLDGTQMGLRYPTEVNLTGDAGPTLRALLRRAGPRPRARPAWRATVADATSALAPRAARTWPGSPPTRSTRSCSSTPSTTRCPTT